MNDFTPGIIVFALANAGVALLMVSALRRARQEGVSGQALLGRLAPYLIADFALVAVFVVWLLGRG